MLEGKCGVWINLPTTLVINLVEIAIKEIFYVPLRFNYYKPCTKTRYLFMLHKIVIII